MNSFTSSTPHEISFMANYALTTLLSLYRRLNLDKPIRLRIVNKHLEISGDAAEIIRVWYVLNELAYAVKSALRRLQALMSEELILVEAGPLLGKPVTSLAASFLPASMPARVTILSFETPANLLLAATIAEVANRLRSIEQQLRKAQRANSNPLIDFAVKRLRTMISRCNYLLNDPVLKPLARKADVIARDKRLLEKLENQVSSDAARRPREYRAYYRLLKLREKLRSSVHALEKFLLDGDILALKLQPSKLYELYGFSLLLEALLETLGTDSLQADVDDEQKVLIIKKNGVKVYVSYNALPGGVNSRLAAAKAYGLIADSIDQTLVRKLGGIPDTIVLMKSEGKTRLLVVDYKYTRSLSYLVASRFKAFSYLYEFHADCASIVAPTVELKSRDFDDEEEHEHSSFYESLITHGGAIIEIDSNDKLLAIVYADPNEKGAENAKRAFKKLFSLLLSE